MTEQPGQTGAASEVLPSFVVVSTGFESVAEEPPLRLSHADERAMRTRLAALHDWRVRSWAKARNHVVG